MINIQKKLNQLNAVKICNSWCPTVAMTTEALAIMQGRGLNPLNKRHRHKCGIHRIEVINWELTNSQGEISPATCHVMGIK